jgi:hypothetical protein
MVVVTPPSKGNPAMSVHADAATIVNVVLLEALIDKLHENGLLARADIANTFEAATSLLDETTRDWASEIVLKVASEMLIGLAQDWSESPEAP